MKPVIVLLSVFVISLFATKIVGDNFDFILSGQIAMSAMLMFTAIAHFLFTKGMGMMLPDFFPFKTSIVYFTGILEISAALGLLISEARILTAWCLIAFFVLILPANIYAAIKHVDYQKATYEGKGLNYLWFRVPLQILFIVWVYLCGIN